MLDHLTNNAIQIGGISGLDHLTNQFSIFLLSCKVNGLSEATLRNYRYQLGRFVQFNLEAQQGDAHYITAHHIRLFLLKLQETNGPISVSDYYKTIKRFFNWLVEEGIIEKSPAQNIRLSKIPKLIPKPFSQQDIENLLLLCSGNKFLEVRNRAIVLLFLDTGLRLSELANIQLRDIDFDQETIKVMGKGAKERRVRMGKTAQKALFRYLLLRQDNLPNLWITEERRPLTPAGVQVTIKRLCQRAKIKDAKPGPHTFRHTFATMAIRNGANIFYVQSLLGHETLTMTRRYAATIDSEDAIKAHRQASPVDNMLK